MRKVVMFMLFISMDGVYTENRQERFQCIFHYSLFIFHCLLTAAQSKIEVNERKYPVEKTKGSAKKYTEYV